MKSIVLIVLLALSHSSMGKPLDCDSEPLEQRFQIFQQNGGKPILISSVEADGVEESGIVTKDVEHTFESAHSVDHSPDSDDAVDCDCNKAKAKPKVTYGPEQVVKGKPETYIHHQPKIIVRQPPTHVRIEHPPTIIQPSTIVFRRHGKTIRRPVIYQHLPRDVRMRPVIVKLVQPIEKKILVDKKEVHGAPCAKLAQHKVKDDHVHNLEYETESYGGEAFSESFDEHVHEHESFRAHLKIKETEPLE